MRLYETSFLIAPNLPEEETEKLIEKMAGIISENKGKMINVDKWGKRRLAYPIKKFEDAVYVFFVYKGDAEIPTELERNFKQTESIIRYLTIKIEERDNVRKAKKGVPRTAEAPHEEPLEEKELEEEEGFEEYLVDPDLEEKPMVEDTAEVKKEEKKAGTKEVKPEEKKEEKKEEKAAPAKKKEETKDTAPKKKGKDAGTKKKETVPEKKEAAVKEKKEK
jgi:small subunit ribosomal protein S6